MLSKLRHLGDRGDTIVEVLVVVVVIATVIGGAYGIANRSQKASQQTQEHTQALKLAEGQLEALRAHPGTITDTRFCFSGSTVTNIPNPAQYPVDCRRSSTGGACDSASFCYNVGITKTSGSDLYTVEVWWDGITGKRDSVKLFYRMPPV